MNKPWLSKVYSLALLSSDRCLHSFPKLGYDLAITWFTWKSNDELNDVQDWYLCMLSLVIIKLYQDVCFGSFTIYHQWHSVLIPWFLTILRILFILFLVCPLGYVSIGKINLIPFFNQPLKSWSAFIILVFEVNHIRYLPCFPYWSFSSYSLAHECRS